MPDFDGSKKDGQILVRITAEQKDAICSAAKAVDMSPPSLMRAIVSKFLEDVGYLEKPKLWDLQELSGFLEDTRNESSCKEKG